MFASARSMRAPSTATWHWLVRKRERQRDAALPRLRLHRVRYLGDDLLQRHVLYIEPQRAGIDLRQLEQVIDHAAQAVDRAPHRHVVPAHFRRIVDDAVIQRLHHRPHARERRPQVVRDRGRQLSALCVEAARSSSSCLQLASPAR